MLFINKIAVFVFKEKYELPDYSIVESDKDFDVNIWQPEKLYIILGRSDSFEQAVNSDIESNDEIIVIKRPSGGHTVVLSPKTIVISAVFKNTILKSKDIFIKMNNFIINELIKFGVENLKEKGISDITIGDKKILGSSIYKNPGFTFYHAVLNHSEDAEIIEQFLNHPVREPDYRQGRKHKDFVTSIKKSGYNFTIEELLKNIKMDIKKLSG